MAWNDRPSEVLPFTLTETFVLLAFLLLLLLSMTTQEVASIRKCEDNTTDDEICRTVAIPDSIIPPEGFDGIVRLFPCNLEEEGECFPPPPPEVEKCAEEMQPGEVCIPVDLTRVPEIEKCLEEVGPGEVCIPVDKEEVEPPGEPGSCWRIPREGGPNSEIVYALQVIMEPNSLRITKMWPDEYRDAAKADTVPGLVALSQAGEISYEEYDRFGPQILDWSRSQEPECRLYVEIRHESGEWGFDGAVDAILARQTLVEKFFYKRNNSRSIESR
jgi:hypothetical protein